MPWNTELDKDNAAWVIRGGGAWRGHWRDQPHNHILGAGNEPHGYWCVAALKRGSNVSGKTGRNSGSQCLHGLGGQPDHSRFEEEPSAADVCVATSGEVVPSLPSRRSLRLWCAGRTDVHHIPVHALGGSQGRPTLHLEATIYKNERPNGMMYY